MAPLEFNADHRLPVMDKCPTSKHSDWSTVVRGAKLLTIHKSAPLTESKDTTKYVAPMVGGVANTTGCTPTTAGFFPEAGIA